MEYRVCSVCDRKTLNAFLRVPARVYRDDPVWVAPLSSEVRRTLDERRNPYFTGASLRLFVCVRNGEAVARVAVIISRRHNEKFGTKAAFFGFFESIDDAEAVRILFDAATAHCQLERIDVLEGPFNPNHYSELGLQISGFGTMASFFQVHNPEYYPRMLEAIGFRRTCTVFTAKNENIRRYLHGRYTEQPSPLHLNGYSVRPLNLRNLRSDLESMREVFNDAFAANWHFLPVSREEFAFSSKFLRLVTEPELIVIVEHEGRAVGVLIFVLDINPLLQQFQGRFGPIKYWRFLCQRKRVQKLIVYAVGIKRSYQRTRVFALLLNEAVRIASRYECLETTWMSENNALAMRAAERLGMQPDKQFGIFEKNIATSEGILKGMSCKRNRARLIGA